MRIIIDTDSMDIDIKPSEADRKKTADKVLLDVTSGCCSFLAGFAVENIEDEKNRRYYAEFVHKSLLFGIDTAEELQEGEE